MKRLVLLLVLISTHVYGQQSSKEMAKEFNALVNVEDQERFYNELLSKYPADPAKPAQYAEYRAQLAIDWLKKGNIDRYHFYKNTNPKFTAIQLFELSNLLESWVDDDQHIEWVQQISKQVLGEIALKRHDDTFDRNGVLLEVNAVANAKLGNLAIAMENIKKSDKNATFRKFPYFRNSNANYLNRLGLILLAAGRHQQAFDTLSKAVRTAASTPKTVVSLKAAYQKVKGSKSGMDKYISSLQEEAYQKVAKEVAKAWIADTKPVPDVTLTDMNGKAVKLADYKGKIVVIDFWSTACKPCVAAFPAFERAINLYGKEPFQLFVINEGESPDIVKPYMEKKGYKLDVLFDQDETMFKALGALGTPQKFIINAKGDINQTGIGYAGSDDKEFYKLKAMVELAKVKLTNSK
ncbi:TlpA disulfide reductase family protein [Pedobacter africanus]|uniref:Thiol-disulfide isomerase or thioredoxin n=1 Tax=Pedobacter africanus TaxID=151894 RepID=A0A1W2A2Z8_9SPHI|nr:TlpA disulfide reductase family protein [Pedobacter africanus]SMC55067.1 Thiol-disulfide isomerase or thioredoxin [Pedobacter africanus]